jgi:hypothetical protein
MRVKGAVARGEQEEEDMDCKATPRVAEQVQQVVIVDD